MFKRIKISAYIIYLFVHLFKVYKFLLGGVLSITLCWKVVQLYFLFPRGAIVHNSVVSKKGKKKGNENILIGHYTKCMNISLTLQGGV